MKATGAVFRKELVDHLRDRRSVLSALVFPLLWPAIFGVMLTLVASWESTRRPLRIPVSGQANAPSLVAFLERAGAEVLDAPTDYEKRVRDGDEEMTLVIPKDYAQSFGAARPAALQLFADSSNNKTHRSVERARRLLQVYASEIASLRLIARGVSPTLAEALDLDEVDVASKQEQAANLLNMIPVFLLMAAFLGGMHVAIDTMAGERERGSLEPLVITPVSRVGLVVGKWLATLCLSALGFSTTVLGFMLFMRWVPLEDLGLRASLGSRELLGLLGVFAPLLAFSSALQMLVSTFARSFKEAQSYLSLMMLFPSVPGMILSFNPFKTRPWMTAVPTLGQQLLASRVMRGEPFHMALYSLAAVSTLAAAAVCLLLTVRLLTQEKIIFGR
jgi:sodium transport system permease protein